MKKYRIVKDRYAGYECQVLYWWFPFFWFQMGAINTHASIEKAKEYINNPQTTVWESHPTQIKQWEKKR